MKSGFVALAGRPNAGKSTLVNRIVGGKVAIVSDKPQTTRREIRGIATGPDWQLVLVDLPGVQRPRDALTERMQRSVERGLADADAVLFVLNGELRFAVFKRVRGVGFFDAGNVYPAISTISLRELQVGAGGGVRLDTPIGLIRFEVGVPVNRRPSDPRWRFHFGLGHAV